MFTHRSVQKVVWNTKDQTYLRALRSFKGALLSFGWTWCVSVLLAASGD